MRLVFGRLGEVGIGVVCKVLSGRQGGVRSYWVRRDLTRFGVAGMVSEVWIDKTQLGMVRCGSFWQVRCDQARRGMVGRT